MASQQNSSFSSSGCVYDVFLSFRGGDTGKNFVSHLYKALDHKGIYTFKDDETLQRGKEITPGILKAIEESRCSIIVFSEDYASSEWCLDELVKCLECMDRFGQTVLPIFYEMAPSNLTDQTGSYAKALAKHEVDSEDAIKKVKQWKSTITRAAGLSGWDSRSRKNETQLIEDVVEGVLEKLTCTVLSTGGENLVGIHSHIRAMKSLLCLQMQDVRIIGIWGMEGVGKTTVAKALYEQMSGGFGGRCFLEDVKESFRDSSGAASLGNELLCQIFTERNRHKSPFGADSASEIKSMLCWKKVLMVLDDVDHLEQLESLVGNHDWFASGSRVIITTRDKQLLITHGANEIYEVKPLHNDNALKLFSQYAFKQNYPPEEFMKLSCDAIKHARGLPKALKALGSFLFGRTKSQWEDKLVEMKSIPHMEIRNVI